MASITVLILDLTVLGLGGLISFLSYLAYQESEEMSYVYACAGFGIISLSAITADAIVLMSSEMELMGDHVRPVMMILGFGLLIYGGEVAE